MNPPQPPALDAAAQTARIVKELFNLPVHEDSSALKRMDAWVIADYIAAAVQAESRKLLERITQSLPEVPALYERYEYKQGFQEAVKLTRALLDSEQQKLGGYGQIRSEG